MKKDCIGVGEKEQQRILKVGEVKSGRCEKQQDLRYTFKRWGMLTLVGTHLTKWGSKLAGLINRALNWIQQGKGMHF